MNNSMVNGRLGNRFSGGLSMDRLMLIVISVLVWVFELALAAFIVYDRLPYLVRVCLCAFMLFHLLPWVSALKSLRRLSTVVDERTRDHWTESGFIIQLLTTTYAIICCGEAMGMALYRLGMLQMLGYR